MSTNYRFPTLDVDDLRSVAFEDEERGYSYENYQENYPEQESGIDTREQNEDSRQIFALLAETRRLSTENSALRHCLLLTRQQSDLKTANYATSALKWCDDRLKQYTDDLYLAKTRPSRFSDSSKPPSAFRPVSPKTFDRTQQSIWPKPKLYAEDWVKRNTSPTNDLRSQTAVKSKPAAVKIPPRPASHPPWEQSLRKYRSPDSTPRPRSVSRERRSKYSPTQSLGASYKKPANARRSSIPVPVRQVKEDYHSFTPLRPRSASPIGEKRMSPPRTALFTDMDSFRSPTGRQSSSPLARQSKSPVGRQNPSLAGRRAPSPSGRETPFAPVRTPSPKVMYGNPREAPNRSPVKFDIPDQVMPTTSVRQRSMSPPRPTTPQQPGSSSPWGMVSGSLSPSRGKALSPSQAPIARPRTPSPRAAPTTLPRSRSSSPETDTKSRSSSPRGPDSRGKFCQGSPRTLTRDPLIKVQNTSYPRTFTKDPLIKAPTIPYQSNYESYLEDVGRPYSQEDDTTESTDDYFASERNGSRRNPVMPSTRHLQYEQIGQPIAMSTPVSQQKRLKASPRGNLTGRTDPAKEDSLAQLLGLSGHGADQKARGVVYRPVDTLTGYRPNITPQLKSRLSQVKHNRRIAGEIAFQLDRRILENVFASVRKQKKNARYYGYSLTNIMQMIYKEAGKEGYHNSKVELGLRTRLETILRKLAPFGYELDIHAERSQDMVNKYGLLNGPPDPNTVRGFGLEDPTVLRIILSKVIHNDDELQDMLIMLDCLCYLSYEDGQPIFMW